MDPETIYNTVLHRYTTTALSPSSPTHSTLIAQSSGYTPSDLSSTPQTANLGLSCSNPLAHANLLPGETVIDLGCGAGFDCFLAARKVGLKGHVIGVDMNENMLAKARVNAAKMGTQNTSFVASKITHVELPDGVADVVVSNCVINLVPGGEKGGVFREMFRLLRPGGRVAVGDILAREELPEEMKRDLALYVGCVAGASRKEEYEMWLEEAGFKQVLVVEADMDLNVYTQVDDQAGIGEHCCERNEEEFSSVCITDVDSGGCCGGKEKDVGVLEGMKTNFRDVDLNEWAGSFKIFAVKET